MIQRFFPIIAAVLLLSGCSIWPVNQDPAGMQYRREADRVIEALQTYQRDNASFPKTLDALTPRYLDALPDLPGLLYNYRTGSLEYRYIPSWPQLRPVWCNSIGNTTDWKCDEHLL
jgi:hypothetical protein